MIRRGIALFVAVLLLAGISSSQARQKTTLSIGIYAGGRWDMPISDSDIFFDLLIDTFEQRFPDVQVVYESGVLKQDYSEWLADRIMKNEVPDVFLVLQQDLNYLSRIGVLEDLDVWIARDEDYDSERFFSSALNEGMVNGRHYALAYEVAPMLMLVNKTLLEDSGADDPKDGWSLEDFYEICRQVTRDVDSDGKMDQFGVYDFTWREVMYNMNIRLFNDGGSEAYFDQAAMQDVISYMKRLAALNGYQKPTSNDFDSGRVAFRPFLFSAYKAYKPYPYCLKKYSNFEWDCLPMPGSNEMDGVSVLQSALIGMSAFSDEKQLAWELIQQILDADIQKSLINYSYGIPVLKEIFLDPYVEILQSDEMLNIETIMDVVERAVSEYSFSSYSEVMSYADREISDIIESDADISYGLLKLNNEINEMLTP